MPHRDWTPKYTRDMDVLERVQQRKTGNNKTKRRLRGIYSCLQSAQRETGSLKQCPVTGPEIGGTN